MTIERDDPEVQRRSGESESAEAPARPRNPEEARLDAWARTIGRTLVHDGLPAPVVDTIVHEAVLGYRTFRGSVPDPYVFLARRILTKGGLHLQRRGIKPPSDPGARVPHLLDLVRTNVALDLLGETAGRALLLMFDGRNRSYQDVADELDLSHDGAKRLVEKSLNKLRKWLAQFRPQE